MAPGRYPTPMTRLSLRQNKPRHPATIKVPGRRVPTEYVHVILANNGVVEYVGPSSARQRLPQGVSAGTVRSALHADAAGGLEALRPLNPHPQTPAGDRQATTLLGAFTAQPPHTVPEAGDRIESLTGVRRGPTPVRAWLKQRGWPSAHRSNPHPCEPGRAAAFSGCRTYPKFTRGRDMAPPVFSSKRGVSSWSPGGV